MLHKRDPSFMDHETMLPEGAVENSPGQIRRGGRSPGEAMPFDLISPGGVADQNLCPI